MGGLGSHHDGLDRQLRAREPRDSKRLRATEAVVNGLEVFGSLSRLRMCKFLIMATNYEVVVVIGLEGS